MPYFKKDDRGGGSNRGGFRSGGGRGNFKGPQTMHDATCGNCGNPCQVPFRPTGERPVYCSDCFSKMGGGPNPSRFDGDDRRQIQPKFAPPMPNHNAGSNDDLKKQLESVNSKLERLIAAVQALAVVYKVEVPAKKVAKKTDKK